MRPFDRANDGSGAYVAGLSTPERLVLAQVTGDVVELLGGEESYFADDETPAQEPDERAGDPRTDPRTDPLPDAETDAAASAASADEAFGALRGVFDGIQGPAVEAPTDSAVRRLLPDASRDPEVAAEFRRYTDDDLRQRKVERLLLFAELLLEVPPSADESDQLDFVIMVDEAEAIAGALADIRLVIGERLGLRSDEDSEELYEAVTATWQGDDDDEGDDDEGSRSRSTAGEGMGGPRLFLGSVFLLAGYLQESLTDCMLEDFRRRKHRH